ncbi:sigma-54-dependent Fis family transcriptional regulator [Achromobacter denitrificans]|uniref:sigma-54-dependent Fis family transcriptional regulator n=1 Tax=Achromobacter denitrificans TaxID=32002 RepID=UPI00166EABB0|nr:sigma-54-dependent Fis family transcriptional regulator [Achromobacter denitrificans]GFN26160.1 sigma-54-dependent Fis family transcriptional regulator [Achromobacter denitrificans]
MSALVSSQTLPCPMDTAPLIHDSWQRCYERYGLSPDRVPRPDVLTQAELNAARAPTESLETLAHGELSRMLGQLGSHVQLLMLADAGGTLMLVRSDPTLDDVCRSASIQPGAMFSESSQGTNGIGLCIQTRLPVSVVMEDHFAQRLSGLSCTVAPIFGERGDLAAVLNVTSLQPSNRMVHEIARRVVEASARRIENRSFDIRHAGRVLVRLSATGDFCDPAGEGRLALDDAGRVLDATPFTLEMLGAGPRIFGERLPGMNAIDALLRIAQSDTPFIERDGRRLSIQIDHRERRRSTYPLATGTPAAPAGRSAAPTLALIAGADTDTQEQMRIAQRLYARGLPILLQGDSGSGKSALARALHEAGPRRAGAFVSINCAAIPAELIESELFGYRAGAFTGASKAGARGRILEADGGTLFLDEIGDMPLALQSRFLQVLSDKEFVPVGASQPVRVDFNLIAASFRDIEGMVRDQAFRADLHFRIQGAALRLPPLRSRDDLNALIDHAFQEAAVAADVPCPRLSAAARAALLRHPWPGNIRELHHVARYALALCDADEVSPDCLPPAFRPGGDKAADTEARSALDLASVLARFEWNVTLAAHRLGISRSTLHRRMRAQGVHRPG